MHGALVRAPPPPPFYQPSPHPPGNGNLCILFYHGEIHQQEQITAEGDEM